MYQPPSLLVSRCLALLLFAGTQVIVIAEDTPQRLFRIDKRMPLTTSKIIGSPEPPPLYRTVNAFPNLHFDEPLAMMPIPGGNRLAVVQQSGKIFSFINDMQVKQPDLLIDMEKIVYGVAFHPEFRSNGYLYVTYLTDSDPLKELPLGTRISRFRVTQYDPPRADPKSEQLIFQWPSGGHNGGCLKFGPDGYLYIATGDSGLISDMYLNGQDLSNVSGAILRIDVDQSVDETHYRIPADNPFVHIEGARSEIWAYGLRQAWKISFDHATGDLWAGHVGQDLWEQIYRIERGGNYGWSVMEGSHPFRPERKRGPTPFLPPIVEHNHAQFRSITGGFVYHGTQLPKLRGAYIYGDYDTGLIWMLRYDSHAKKVHENRQLADSSLRLVGFAEDHQGELYLVDHMRGQIFQLEPNSQQNISNIFPRKLSDTGLFDSVADHQIATGVIPYTVIAPQWIDGAVKERFLAIPGKGQIQFDGIEYPQPAPGAPHGWKFPDGTVVFETISLELRPGMSRRLETRVLHYKSLAGDDSVGDQFWRAYTYIWNDEQTDAVLLEETHGREQIFTIQDPTAPGGKRQQTWHFPSRMECIVCHNMAAKYVVGINTMQMNHDYEYAGGLVNQLHAFDQLGLFTEPLKEKPAQLPRLVNYHDRSQDLHQRARSYLHANCSHCHRKWGGGNAEFLLLGNLPIDDMNIVGKHPGRGSFFIPKASLLESGDPAASVILYRMSTTGPGRMPRLDSRIVDVAGIQLIHDWIASLPTKSDKRLHITERLTGSEDAKTRSQKIDTLLGETTSALQLLQVIDRQQLPDKIVQEVIARGARHTEAHIRDLFERYLPEEQRTQRLGSIIQPEQILALDGNLERGITLFAHTSGVQCKSCHKIGDVGTDLGPDLSQIGKKYDKAKILENILDPSREIDPKFRVHLIETADGKVYTGLLVEKTLQQVMLKDAKNKVIHLDTEEIEAIMPQQQSLMPDLLLRDLTAQQVADLIAYLGSLKGP